MKKIKLLAVLTAMAALTFGLMSCSEPNWKGSNDDTGASGDTGNTDSTSLPASVGVDPFAGKTFLTGSLEFDGFWWEAPVVQEFEFGNDKAVRVLDYNYDMNKSEYVKNETSYVYDYTYDTTKKEIYIKLNYISYTPEPSEPIEKSVASEEVKYYAKDVATIAEKGAEAGVERVDEFKDDSSKNAYKDMLRTGIEKTYAKLFSEMTTIKYELDTADATISVTLVSDSVHCGGRISENLVLLSDSSFDYGNYSACTVTVDKANKTFVATDIYKLIITEKGQGEYAYEEYECSKVEGSFEGTYEITKVKGDDDDYDTATFTFTKKPAEVTE